MLVAMTLLAQTALAQTATTSVTVEQAVELARTSNEDMEVARQQIERSRAIRRETLAGLLPRISAGLSGSLNGPEVTIGDRTVTQKWGWGGNLTGSVVIFDGSLYPAYSETGELLEASENERAWVEHTLEFEVEQAFYLLAAAQEELAVAERTIELREAYLERAEALSAQGVALPIDVARARNQFLSAQQAVLSSRARVGNLADALSILLVREPDGELRAAAKDSILAPPEEGSADLPIRADIAAQQNFVQSLEDRKDSVWWSLFPTVDLRANGRVGPASFTAPDGFAWTIALNLSWLIYDGGARYARMDAIEAETRQAELRVERARREVDADEIRALRDWRTAFEAIEVARENVEVTREAYDMAVARFEAGLATSIEVNDASEQLVQAEQQLVARELENRLAASQYRYVIGIPR